MLIIRRKCGFRASSSATVLFLLTRCSSNSSTSAFPLSLSHTRTYQDRFATMDNTETSPHKRSRESSCGPLVCSRRVRQLFQHAFMSTDSNQQQPTSDVVSNELGAKQQRDVAKKRRRPQNSYLKVVLDDDTMDRLHGFAVKLQKDIESKLQNDVLITSNDDEGTESESVKLQNDKQSTLQKDTLITSNDNEGTKSETPTTRKGLKFRSRSRTSLHLTLFFGGEVLCALPPTELIDWHAKVKTRLEQSNFVLKSDTVEQCNPESSDAEPTTDTCLEHSSFIVNSDCVEQSDGERIEAEPTEPQVPEECEQEEYWFRLTGLSLFPPRRNYLIVALLEASPSWHALHDEIRNVALNGDSESLRSMTKRSKREWMPHITLGNVYGGKKADLVAVQAMLQKFPLNHHEEDDTPEAEHSKAVVDRIVPTRISMGGPVPGQVELDWNFHSENR